MPLMSQGRIAWVCVAVAAVAAASARDGLAQAAKEAGAEPKAVERPSDEARLAAVLKSLDVRLDADFVDAPFRDVAEFVGSKAGVRIVLDRRALESAGYGADTSVTFSSKQLPLRSLLNLLLHRYGLTWVVQPGSLRITSVEESSKHVQAMALDVSDLILPGSPQMEERRTALVDMIQNHTGHPSPGWIDEGGLGRVSLSNEGVLIISTVGPVQRDIETLVEVVRGEARRVAKKSDWKPAVIASAADESHAEIRAKLEALASLDFADAPLGDVCAFIADRQQLPIHVDQRGLESAGFGIDSPVTLKVTNAPLCELLRELLDPMELTYVVRDHVVFVTSREESLKECRWRVYAMADLADSEDDEEAAEQLDALNQLIQTHTGNPGPGWMDDGEVGAVSSVALARSLVISTTDEVHDEVQRLLSEIRRRRRAAAAPPASPAYEQRAYRWVKTDDGQAVIEPKELLELIRESLPKGHWKREPRQVGELYIIEQTPRGHRDIQRAMQRLGIPLLRNGGGLGGGLGPSLGGGMGGGGGFF